MYHRCPKPIKFLLNKAFPPIYKFDSYHGNAEEFKKNLDKVQKFLEDRLRHSVITSLITDLSMLICFGALFPPLALVIAVSIGKDIFDIKLALGRIELIIEELTEEGQDELKVLMMKAREKIYHDIKIAEVEVVKGLWWGLSIATVVWGFVLLDTLSPYMGPLKSVWVIVFMAVVPLGSYSLLSRFYSVKEVVVENEKPIDVVGSAVVVDNPLLKHVDIELKEM